MEEYISELLSQIRCKKAHGYIAEEIKGHIEDQIADNLASGMEQTEAEKQAVLDMGDPIEVGISMDRIHRPKANWRMLAVVILISALSVGVHYLINQDFYTIQSQQEGVVPNVAIQSTFSYIMSTLFGILAMFVVYRMDYTFVAKHAKVIALLMASIALFCSYFGTTINGRVMFLSIGAFHFPLSAFMMLYLPVYGAILYQYRNRKGNSIAHSILWLAPMLFAAVAGRCIFVGFFLMLSGLMMISIAVWDNWFLVSKGKALALLWGYFIGVPTIMLLLLLWRGQVPSYRMERINAWIYKSGEAGYLPSMLMENIRLSHLIGGNGKNLWKSIPNFSQDFIFTYILGRYGIVAGILVVLLLAVLVAMMFHSSFHLKNKVGMMMGCGCGMVIGVSLSVNVLENLGILPLSQTFLPFFSQGMSNQLMCYVVLGWMLSIYRFKDVYPKSIIEDNMDKKETFLSRKWEAFCKNLEIGLETDCEE